MIKPVAQPTPAKQYYREERKWDQNKMKIVTKKIPCSFQEMLESANEERQKINKHDKGRN